ncbi:hypothetical protein DID75_03380 [Candidatus Marinamargulisbacteria bacterium SCGC AG-410-N11]|nr:hypothetical protein DID75_03380 [Candidatus Marinamargulisbacteria bacterium SCGC AG-410-N11]
MNNKSNLGFFDNLSNKKLLWKILLGFGFVLFISEFFVERYGYFGEDSLDGLFGFYPILGLLVTIIIVTLVNILGKLLLVEENFYD